MFLSATIPNALQFAKWICYIHSQVGQAAQRTLRLLTKRSRATSCTQTTAPRHCSTTSIRPAPMGCISWSTSRVRRSPGHAPRNAPAGNFREDNFAKAMLSLTDSASNAATSGKAPGRDKKGMKGGSSNVFKIVKMIMERHYEPVIVFSFSKRECEAHAMAMSKLDFNTGSCSLQVRLDSRRAEDEKALVEEVFGNAIASLSDDDKHLPQVEHVLPLLKRGIGIHHSGLLPLLKEVIEILFGEGLVKVLFATETFAMGLNMPARTVVFTSIRKFDGKDFRWVLAAVHVDAFDARFS